MACLRDDIDQTLDHLKSRLESIWMIHMFLTLAYQYIFVLAVFKNNNRVFWNDSLFAVLSLTTRWCFCSKGAVPPCHPLFWSFPVSTLYPSQKAIWNESAHWAGLQCGLYSLFSTKYLPFSWTCHHPYQPFSKLDPGQMAWSPSPSIPTVAPVTSVTYRGTVSTERAHQDTCPTL